MGGNIPGAVGVLVLTLQGEVLGVLCHGTAIGVTEGIQQERKEHSGDGEIGGTDGGEYSGRSPDQ